MKLLTLSEVAVLLRLSIPTIWRLLKADVAFPQPVKIFADVPSDVEFEFGVAAAPWPA